MFKRLLSLTLVFTIFKITTAFCIYNNVQGNTTTTFWIRQHPQNAGPNYFSRFANYRLAQGEKTCCAYSNTDCVRSGNKEEEIKMVFRRTTGRLEYPPVILSLLGGGWIEFGGGPSPESATVDVYRPDGQPYDYTYTIDYQAGYQ